MSTDTKVLSGRFLLRVGGELHGKLRERAEHAGVSLNTWCAARLGTAHPCLDPRFVDVLGRAEDVVGDALIGLVMYGSFARGTHRDASDIDMLIVIDAHLPLRRDLYRRWDAGGELRCLGHEVQPSFVHLPSADHAGAGLWGEVALDGIVLADSDLRIARHLGAIRRRIAAGELERCRLASGVSYWRRSGRSR